MSKPRLLIPVTFQFSVRYLLRTGLVRRLTGFTHPVILLAWEDTELQREFEAEGCEVHSLPPTHFGPCYMRLRRQIDTWHLARLRSVSTAIDERRMTRDLPSSARHTRRLRHLRNRLLLTVPGASKRLLQREAAVLLDDTNLAEFTALARRLKGDAVFSVTPYHKNEELILRATHQAGLPRCTAILSFDNLTTRGWISCPFDRYLLWNRYNTEELKRAYPEHAGQNSVVVGAPQFDFYSDPSYLWEEKEWRCRLGLPAGRPVILFGGGPVTIAPHEPHFLAQLDEAVDRGDIPDQPVVLFRRHPMDPVDRWKEVLAGAKHVVYDDPWPTGEVIKYSHIRRSDVEKLCSTLFHSHVHVNTSSTMTIDGALFDRPQVGPAYDDRPGRRYDRITRELYEREHYLPITRSGGIAITYSRDELVSAVRSAFEDPAVFREGRRRLLAEICTHTDGKATERVSEELRRFTAQ